MSDDGASASDPRVDQVLEQIRAGVLQRRAESTTLAEGAAGTRGALLALRAREYVQEPVAMSHRGRLGRLIVFARKAFYHLFLKWFQRPVLEQQNAFNETASRLIQELAEAQERQARELRDLRARMAAIEAPPEGRAPGAETATR